MDVMNVTKQMVAFQKQSMNSFQGIWDLAQAQTSSTVDRLMDHNAWIPPEGRQALDKWRTLMKQERDRFAAYVDQYFAIYETMLDAPQAVTPARTEKTTMTNKLPAHRKNFHLGARRPRVARCSVVCSPYGRDQREPPIRIAFLTA
jgi:hypothetical protein